MNHPSNRRGGSRFSRGPGAYALRELGELAGLIAILAVVGLFVDIPLGVLIGLPIAKLATSLVFYGLFLRGVLGRPAQAGPRKLIGKHGETVSRHDPSGQVRVDGAFWSAQSAGGETIPPGASVRVVEVRGNQLRVEPLRGEGWNCPRDH